MKAKASCFEWLGGVAIKSSVVIIKAMINTEVKY